MNRSLITPIALACALLGAASAHATDTVSFGDFANGFEQVDVSVVAPNVPLTESVQAGGFLASVNGGPSVVTYCINLYDGVQLDTTYTNFVLTDTSGHSFANPNAGSDLGKLFAEGNVINTAASQAAMQIAIWEIAYETSGTYNLAQGSATFTGGTAATSGALTLASSWLGALASQSGAVTLGVLESSQMGAFAATQDQVFTPAVPEPSTYALLAGGLMCVGFMARRRAYRRG